MRHELAGAAAVLLITSILDKYQLVDYRELAGELGMDALTEVHQEAEPSGCRVWRADNRSEQPRPSGLFGRSAAYGEDYQTARRSSARVYLRR